MKCWVVLDIWDGVGVVAVYKSKEDALEKVNQSMFYTMLETELRSESLRGKKK